MKSYDAKDHGASDQVAGQAKKPWITPSLEIIALKSAEGGTHPSGLPVAVVTSNVPVPKSFHLSLRRCSSAFPFPEKLLEAEARGRVRSRGIGHLTAEFRFLRA